MMLIQKENPFDFIVSYRLDRITRSVVDFTSLVSNLKKQKTYYLSATEGFDTSTDFGEAMLTILAIFAQLERDAISERIHDNMLQQAKTGHWLGGTVPLGYKSIKHTYTDERFGKERSYYTLDFDENNIDLVKLIFSKYKRITKFERIRTISKRNTKFYT